MKKVSFVLVITVFGSTLWAGSSNKGILRSLYDVVAPVLGGEPAASDRQIGQIFYDNSAGAYKGVNKNGGIDILTSSGPMPKASVSDPTTAGLIYNPDSGYYIVVFTQEDFDSDDMYDASTGVFTAPSAGVYTISSHVGVSVFSPVYDPLDFGAIGILKNGTELLRNQSFYTEGNTPSILMNTTSDFLLQQGDTLSIAVSVVRAANPSAPITVMAGWASFKKVP